MSFQSGYECHCGQTYGRHVWFMICSYVLMSLCPYVLMSFQSGNECHCGQTYGRHVWFMICSYVFLEWE